MKTTEEKAKAYDEVVNKLRHFIAKGVDPLITRADIQDFFPELAESEGEKVIKRITLCLEECVHSDVIRDYEKDECIAWLEKQGADSTILSNSSNIGKDEQKHFDYENANIQQKDFAPKVEPKFKVGDKIYLKPEYRMPDDDTPIANTVKEIRRIDDKHYRFDGSYIFIEDQDKYELVEQKTEENKGNIGGISPNWSEEDKGIIEEVVSYLINYSNIVESKEDADRIEYLIDKIQDICPHQKQEWSEEDEQHIDSLLKRLDALCRDKFERTRFAISEDRDWLKSLRPHNRWKPSDEQIKVCKEVYADILSAKGFDLGTVNSELNRLEEELKKKGE